MEREGSNVSNRPINTLPSSVTSQELARKQFEACSDAEMATFDFGPWELADLCEVPTNDQWFEQTPDALIVMRLASKTVSLRKDDLVEICADMEGKAYDKLLDQLQHWTSLFRMHAALMETASDRMIVALAVRNARTAA